MRVRLKSRSGRCRKIAPSSANVSGSRGSGPASTLKYSATSSTVRAIGPLTASVFQISCEGTRETRPTEGRKPTTLQKLAGLRSEPPRSLPSASATIPHASATAEPPLLPPQVLLGSYGLRVAPKTVLNVCEPAVNSGTFVLPTAIAPAARWRATIVQSSSGTKSL